MRLIGPGKAMGEMAAEAKAGLPEVPFVDARRDGAPAVFDAMPAMGARLLGMGERRYGATAIRVADQQSRAWLVRNRNPYLDEIEAIAARVGRPGRSEERRVGQKGGMKFKSQGV